MFINSTHQLSNTPAGLVSTNYRTTLFRQGRIPRKAKRAENVEDKPGYFCWGSVGSLPSSQPVATVGFNVVGEEHHEISRKTKPVRIENPDDPSQHVDALQTLQMRIERIEKRLAGNSDTKDADFNDYEWPVDEVIQFDETGSIRSRSATYVINFNPDRDQI